MTPEAAAWIAKIRAEATGPGAWAVFVGGKVVIYADEIESRDDETLLAFIKERLAESK
jgi:hypothetical protein